jgi:hypothetical protein
LPASQLAYGLQIEVDVPIPGLLTQSKQQVVDLRIRLNENPPFLSAPFDFVANSYYSSANSGDHDEPNLRVAMLADGQYYGFLYADGARFAVQRSGLEIWADWPSGYTFEDACTYLVGPVIAFALRLRGETCLHASAIAVGNRAIVLIGSPGAGKSTTAAAFAKLGFPVLSDDVVVLTGSGDSPLVQPGYPRLNLWPDAVRLLFGSREALPLITPTWGKRYLQLGSHGDYRFQSSPLPLGAVYILGQREAALTVPAIENAAGSRALMLLVANAYGSRLLNEEMQMRDFQALSRVAAQVSVRHVRPPADPSKVYALCDAIASNAREIPQHSPNGSSIS